MKPWIASFGSSPTTAGAAAYIACTSRSLGGFAAAAATAPMPAARMTTGGSVVIARHLARRRDLGGPLGLALHDAQVHVFEMHLALDDAGDLRAAVDESAYEERIRPQR